MPELNLRIFSRNYRLAVTPGEEPVLEQCAQRVDQHMEAIRSAFRHRNFTHSITEKKSGKRKKNCACQMPIS